MKDQIRDYFIRQLKQHRVPEEDWGPVLDAANEACVKLEEAAGKSVTQEWKKLRYGKGL